MISSYSAGVQKSNLRFVLEVGGRGSSERGVQSARVRGELIEIAKERRIKLVVQRGCAEVAKVAEGGVRGDALGQARVEVAGLVERRRLLREGVGAGVEIGRAAEGRLVKLVAERRRRGGERRAAGLVS